MTWIYFLGDIDPFRVTFKFLLVNSLNVLINWSEMKKSKVFSHADMQKTNSAACVIFLDAVSICLLSWDLFFAANTYTIRCVVHKIGLSLNF